MLVREKASDAVSWERRDVQASERRLQTAGTLHATRVQWTVWAAEALTLCSGLDQCIKSYSENSVDSWAEAFCPRKCSPEIKTSVCNWEPSSYAAFHLSPTVDCSLKHANNASDQTTITGLEVKAVITPGPMPRSRVRLIVVFCTEVPNAFSVS